MVQHHGYSILELESLVPWERGAYVDLLIQYIEEENKKIQDRNGKNSSY